MGFLDGSTGGFSGLGWDFSYLLRKLFAGKRELQRMANFVEPTDVFRHFLRDKKIVTVNWKRVGVGFM